MTPYLHAHKRLDELHTLCLQNPIVRLHAGRLQTIDLRSHNTVWMTASLQSPLNSNRNACTMEPHTETLQRQIVVCHGINCRRSGAPELMEQLQQALAQDATVAITRYNCFGACDAAPNVVVVPDRLWYSFAMPEYGDHVVEAIRRGAALPGLANHVRPEMADAVFHTLEASPPRQKSVGGLSAASPTHAAESTDEPFAVRRTRQSEL